MIKKILIKLIKVLLWILSKDHRQNHSIEYSNIKKFTHVKEVNLNSDTGKIVKVFRTVPYECWELKTETKTLYGADKHILIDINGNNIFLKDCVENKTILMTETGPEVVKSVRNIGVKCHMYCVEVCDRKHVYYTNGILSHNTTCAAAYILWKTLFTPDQTVLIAANKMASALEIMQRIRFIYEELPEWLKAGVETYNKGTLEFDNGSRIISRATTPDAGRGLSISLLYLDEFAFVKPKIAEEFWTAIQPTLSTGGSCIITSTPNSDEDQFAQLWFGAENTVDENGFERKDGIGSNGFKAILIRWDRHPERDENWAKDQISKLGLDRFERENNCKFIQSDETLINPLKLVSLKGKDPILVTDNNVRWYENINPDSVIIAALDPSLGVGSDYAAIQVFQFPEFIQIAEWRSNNTNTKDQTLILLKILMRIYETLKRKGINSDEKIYWSVENNTLGEAILVAIEDIGEDKFPGTFVHEPRRVGITKPRLRKGLNTTSKQKLVMTSKLKNIIETNKIRINSKLLISELKNYIKTGQSFKAKSGYNDDLISALLLVLRISSVISNYEDQVGEVFKRVIDRELENIEPMPLTFI